MSGKLLSSGNADRSHYVGMLGDVHPLIAIALETPTHGMSTYLTENEKMVGDGNATGRV
jgi:hypothetical protein